MQFVRTIAVISAIVLLTGCRTTSHIETAETNRAAAIHDTLRLLTTRIDTIRDSVFLSIESDRRGDTIFKTVQKVVYRDRISLKRDTVYRVKTDTIRVSEHVDVATTTTKSGGIPILFKLLSVIASAVVAYFIVKRIK